MIEFLNPWLLGGLGAISAPIIIHLLHRRKIKQVEWGAMRFLLEMIAKRRRRLFLDELLLLVVRSLLVACIALAMLRPALHRQSPRAGSNAVARQGRTAAVLLIDDSVSTAAGRAQPAIEAMKKLAATYVDSLAPGDEVSVLQMSQLGTVANDPVFDLEGVKAQLGNLKPSAVSTDIPRLFEAGLAQLKRHINPGAELVLVTDGCKDGWHQDETVRWEELRTRLRGPKGAGPGTRQRPDVLLLSAGGPDINENLAINTIKMDRTLVSAGKSANARIVVSNFGKSNREVAVQVSLNGESLGSRRIEVPSGGQQEAVFDCVFPAPGSYSVEASLVNNQDLLPADDYRAASVQVESSLPVLLVDGTTAEGLETKLGFLEYALDPAAEQHGSFKVTRIPLSQFRASILPDYRVVVLGDVRLLEPVMVDALERFVVAGGGVLVGLGPDTDPQMVNRYWARQGEGFLPCPLARASTPARPAVPAIVSLAHPVFNGFGSQTDEAWKASKVRSFYQVERSALNSPEIEPLLKLEADEILVLERRRGLGLVTMVTTSLNADWTDLPLQAVYVPLMRGIVGRLGSFVMPPRNLEPGQQIIYPHVKDRSKPIAGQGPEGKPLELTVGAWEGRESILSENLFTPGVYLLSDPSEAKPVRFAVALSPAESALSPIADKDVTGLLELARVFHTPEQIASHLDPARRQSVEIWKWLLATALGLIFIEAYMTRREASAGIQ